jgi:putative Holliday junction resolvase
VNTSTSQGRIIALDVGGKRIGVAMSDPDRIVASGQPTLDAQPPKVAFERIRQLVEQNEVVQIVIGLPLTLRGEIGPQAEVIQNFARELGKRVTVPIALYDERLTSVAAERSLEAMGMKKHKRRNHVDEMAATLILQTYMDSLRNPPLPWPPSDEDDWD